MRNTLWGAIYRVATLIGPFAIKTIIIKELGQEYNGLSTLFTSVLTVLNLANLALTAPWCSPCTRPLPRMTSRPCAPC